MWQTAFRSAWRDSNKVRLGIAAVALVALAGCALFAWLLGEGRDGLVVTLLAVLVGWVVALILAERYRDQLSC